MPQPARPAARVIKAQVTGLGEFELRWQGDSTFVAASDDDWRFVFQLARQPQAKSVLLSIGGFAFATSTRVP
jgi:hypothetical protein